jgi:LL-diaminopimelate aminotransferase
MKVAKRLDHINEYYFSTKLKEIAEMNGRGLQVVNLGIGSPDLPPSLATINALAAAAILPTTHAYQSYVGIPALRSAFAQWYERLYKVVLNPNSEVLPLIGSKEGIMHICMTYLETGDKALIPNPGYPTYRSAVTLAGATCMEYALSEAHHWLPDLDALDKMNLKKVKVMFVNYPHMPTGGRANLDFFQKLIAFCKKHQILVVNDNPYSCILNDEPMSMLQIEGWREVGLELNSLSKSHNMAGWRVGMLAGKAEFIQNIVRFKSNMDSGMFLPVQLAAVKALEEGQDWYDGLNKVYRERQQKVFDLLNLLNCDFDRKQTGMFVWAKIPAPYKTGFELSDEILYGANVFITPGGIFGSQGNGYIRVSLCAQVTVFENAIQRIIEFKKNQTEKKVNIKTSVEI